MLSEHEVLSICDHYIDAMIWAHSPNDIDRIMKAASKDSDINAFHLYQLVALSDSFREKLSMV